MQTAAQFVLLPLGNLKSSIWKTESAIKKSWEMDCFYLSMHND